MPRVRAPLNAPSTAAAHRPAPIPTVRSSTWMRRRTELWFRRTDLPGLPFLGKLDYDVAYPWLAPHRHPPGILELTFLRRGIQTFVEGPNIHTLVPGDVWLCHPGEVHASGDYPHERSIQYWIWIDLRTPARSFLGLPPADAAVLRKCLGEWGEKKFRVPLALWEFFEELIAADREVTSLRPLKLRLAAARLLLALHKYRGEGQPRPSPRVLAAVQHVRSHMTESLGWQELAAVSGIPPRSFRRFFLSEIGLSPAEFVLREKVAASRRLLRQPGADITRVAHDLGFSTSQYFAVVFRRFTGIQPQVFRKGLGPGDTLITHVLPKDRI